MSTFSHNLTSVQLVILESFGGTCTAVIRLANRARAPRWVVRFVQSVRARIEARWDSAVLSTHNL